MDIWKMEKIQKQMDDMNTMANILNFGINDDELTWEAQLILFRIKKGRLKSGNSLNIWCCHLDNIVRKYKNKNSINLKVDSKIRNEMGEKLRLLYEEDIML